MLFVTQSFLDECKGLAYHPMYGPPGVPPTAGMFCDPADGCNYWIEVGPGRRRPAALINAPRDDSPIPEATALALLAATVATADGGFLLPDGSTAHIGDDLALTP